MNSNHWIAIWLEGFGIPAGGPPWLLAAIGLAITFLFVVIPAAGLVSWLDRKLTADFQARVGPNRSGPAGVLQPFSDFLKLLQKQESVSPGAAERAWLLVHSMALYSTVAALPLGSLFLVLDTDMSAFLPFWATLVLAQGLLLLGLNQRTVPGWFGGLRLATQALSGAFPALVALVCVGLRSGTFRWSGLVAAQGAGPLAWAAFSNPFQTIAFVVFVTSGLVALAIPPMDTARVAGDLHGGVSAHLSGRRLSLFRLGRFYGFFMWAVISSVLFLGGWNLPFGAAEALREAGDARLLQLAELLVVVTKALLLMLLITWIARVNPRTRVDQVTDFSWKVLSPFALFALMGAGLVVGLGALS